jgi:hypothetical protein
MTGHGSDNKQFGIVALANGAFGTVEVDEVAKRLALDRIFLNRHLEPADGCSCDAPFGFAIASRDALEDLAHGGDLLGDGAAGKLT